MKTAILLLVTAGALFAQNNISGQTIVWATSNPSGACAGWPALQYNLITGELSGCKNGTWALVTGAASSAIEVARGAICIAAGCGSETSNNGIMMNGSGTITTCGFNLLTAPTGSSVVVEIDKNGSSATTLTLATSATKTKTTGLSIAFVDQDIFTWKITSNDSGLTAQGGTVQCWR